jgi:hypothetical protein
VIVRDDGDSWQVVLQPDHAALAGEFAQQWGTSGSLVRPQALDGVVRASARHDDGWLSWEREPVLDQSGAPKSFTAVSTPLQMDFYTGCIATLEDVDPYAALLTSMHACSLYGSDLGWTGPPLREEARPAAARFRATNEALFSERRARIGIDEAEVSAGFDVLEAVDRLSLFLCMRGDLDEIVIQKAVLADGTAVPMVVKGLEPGLVGLDPFPFAGDSATFELERRVIPKHTWTDESAFRREFFATRTEGRSVTFVPLTDPAKDNAS